MLLCEHINSLTSRTDQLLENYAWELGTPEPAELDDDGNPILEQVLPVYDDDDDPAPPASGPTHKSSLISRFKGMFRKTPDHQAAALAAAAAASQCISVPPISWSQLLFQNVCCQWGLDDLCLQRSHHSCRPFYRYLH